MGLFGGGDRGWGGTFVPMIVDESTLKELRDLAGPPATPGQKWVMVDLETGQFKWYIARTPSRRSSYPRRRRK